MQSYSLSRHLSDDEVLQFFTGHEDDVSGSRYQVDHNMDGHYTEACLLYDSTAGINATEDDTHGHGRLKGCHNLINNEWCANMWVNGSTTT